MNKDFYEKHWKGSDRTEGFSMKILKESVSESSILDLGCGDGAHLKVLLEKDAGRRVHGVDVSVEAVERARKNGIPAEVGDISSPLRFSDDSFEAVLLLDVLEHFLEPRKLIREAARVASKSIYISVPNFVSLPARLQVLRGGVPENNSRSKGHVYWFTRTVLKKMLDDADLKVEREYTHTFWQDKPLLGVVTGAGLRFFPSVFGLSFVVRAVKRNSEQ